MLFTSPVSCQAAKRRSLPGRVATRAEVGCTLLAGARVDARGRGLTDEDLSAASEAFLFGQI